MVHVRVLPDSHIDNVDLRQSLSDGLDHPVALGGGPAQPVPGHNREGGLA